MLFRSIVSMIAYHIGLGTNAQMASSMAFATLTLARLFHGFNCRSKSSIFEIGFGSNLYSVAAFFAGTALLLLVLFVPFLHGVFDVAVISSVEVLKIAGLALLPTVIIQIVKVINRK